MKSITAFKWIQKNKYLSLALRFALCILISVGMYLCAVSIANVRFDKAKDKSDLGEVDISEDNFYYNSLTPDAKALYLLLSDSVPGKETNTGWARTRIDEETFAALIDAFLLDHPEVFYLDGGGIALHTSVHASRLTLTYDALAEAKAEQLSSAVSTLTADIDLENERLAASTLMERLISVCTYPKDNDTDTKVGDTAYDALVLGVANGRGYALAYQLLCDTVGISCETVVGVVGESSHAWNMVTLDGDVGYTDVMWCDIPEMNEEEGDDASPAFHGYDFLSLEEMSLDHTPSDPALLENTDTENYYEYHGMHAETRDDLPDVLLTLLTDAREGGKGEIEFSVGEMLTDYILEEYLHTAIDLANEKTFDGTVPYLRTVNRIYHASEARCAVTVRLFYEETENARKS